MRKKSIIWLIISCLVVLAMILASCQTATTEDSEGTTVTGQVTEGEETTDEGEETVTPEETIPEPELTTPPLISEPEGMDIGLETDTSIDKDVPEQELVQPIQKPTPTSAQESDVSIVSPDTSTKPLPVILIPVDEDGDYDGQGVHKDEKGRVTILNPKIMYSPRLPLRKPPIGKVVKLKQKEQ